MLAIKQITMMCTGLNKGMKAVKGGLLHHHHKSKTRCWQKVLMLIFMLITSPVALMAQQPAQMSLEQAIDHALKHNYEILNARADANIAQRQVWEITADGLPQVNGAVGYQYFIDIPTTLLPMEIFGGPAGEFQPVKFGLTHNLNASLSVTQLVFDGSYIVGLQAARVYRELARRGYEKSEIEVRSLVTETYYIALATSQNLDIVKQNLGNLENTLRESEVLFEQGFTDAINVDQLRLTVSNLKNNITSLTRQKAFTLDLLKFQVGMKVDQPLELTDNLQQLLGKLSLESLMASQFDHQVHIDYKLMMSQERMALMAMRRQKSFYLPSLSASYVHQQTAQRNEFNFLQSDKDWFPVSIVGVHLNIPIFSSGLRWSRIQQAKLELEKAQTNTRMMEQNLLLQSQDARNQVSTALDKYNSEKENLELADRILRRTGIMHKEGLASSLELTQASDQFLTTQANYIQAVFDLLNANNRLQKALGRF
jgi:outer membrane protein